MLITLWIKCDSVCINRQLCTGFSIKLCITTKIVHKSSRYSPKILLLNLFFPINPVRNLLYLAFTLQGVEVIISLELITDSATRYLGCLLAWWLAECHVSDRGLLWALARCFHADGL